MWPCVKFNHVSDLPLHIATNAAQVVCLFIIYCQLTQFLKPDFECRTL